MRQMLLGIKFLREAKFRRQKVVGKNRFGELCTEEIQEITDHVAPVKTKKPQSSESDYSMGNFKVPKFQI